MNLNALIQASEKPPIYTPGTAVMWTDPHISEQLLRIHLSQETDLASRKAPAITATIDWISGGLTGKPAAILDLGCGPGLYAERLASMGHEITGVDFSPRSIDHARQSAARQHLGITYLNQDYLSLDHENRYDLVMMIFTDFGVLFPDQRKDLLGRIYRALKPGGRFIFDVLNTGWLTRHPLTRSWEAAQKGFWKNSPYLALSESFSYPHENVVLNQHMVLDEKGGIEVYRFYTHVFSHGGLEAMVSAGGFESVMFKEGLLPPSDLCGAEELIFCTARK